MYSSVPTLKTLEARLGAAGDQQHRVDDVLDVDVGLRLACRRRGSRSCDGSAQQPADEVVRDAVRLARADDVGEPERARAAARTCGSRRRSAPRSRAWTRRRSRSAAAGRDPRRRCARRGRRRRRCRTRRSAAARPRGAAPRARSGSRYVPSQKSMSGWVDRARRCPDWRRSGTSTSMPCAGGGQRVELLDVADDELQARVVSTWASRSRLPGGEIVVDAHPRRVGRRRAGGRRRASR